MPIRSRRLRGLPPLASPAARVLVLGSMPGEASLAAQQYYAHPRNQFWMIAGELFGARPSLAYEERVRVLVGSGVAVWDVLASCRRQSSLDSKIDRSSLRVNDFRAFFEEHRNICLVLLNGATAFDIFRREVAPGVEAALPPCEQMPSTSPANAGTSYRDKLAIWRRGFRRGLGTRARAR